MAKEMMKDVSNSVTKEVSNMKSKIDASPIREDLETLKADTRVVIDDARVLGQDLKAEGKKQWSVAEEKAKQTYYEAKDAGKDKFKALETYVGENPGQALAIAFVGGILASLIFGSRRS